MRLTAESRFNSSCQFDGASSGSPQLLDAISHHMHPTATAHRCKRRAPRAPKREGGGARWCSSDLCFLHQQSMGNRVSQLVMEKCIYQPDLAAGAPSWLGLPKPAALSLPSSTPPPNPPACPLPLLYLVEHCILKLSDAPVCVQLPRPVSTSVCTRSLLCCCELRAPTEHVHGMTAFLLVMQTQTGLREAPLDRFAVTAALTAEAAAQQFLGTNRPPGRAFRLLQRVNML